MKVLDLFCGAGGAAMGLHWAWPNAEIIGVDIVPQKHYPFTFVQADAMTYPLDGFDFIWASPPCQAYTMMQALNTRAPKRDHPKLIEPIRKRLISAGVPYVIENVPGAPLVDPVMLCGSMFGLRVRRHRLFEASFFMLTQQCTHDGAMPIPVWGDGRPSRQEVRRRLRPIAVYGDHPQQPGDRTYRVNRARTLEEGRQAMGIDWMAWHPLTQAIPPAYSEFIARQMQQEVLDLR